MKLSGDTYGATAGNLAADESESGAAGYAAGDAGADALAADIISDFNGDANVSEWNAWLAHNSATYRTLGVGDDIATLLSINDNVTKPGGIDATNGTGSQRPHMDAGNGPSGRDQMTLSAAASQHLAADGYSTASGDRWGVMVVGQFTNTATGVMAGFGSNSVVVQLAQIAGTPAISRMLLQHDPGDVADIVRTDDRDGSPHLIGAVSSVPHRAFYDGATTDSAITAGGSIRYNTDGTGIMVIGGQHSSGSFGAPVEGNIYCTVLWKQAGTTTPSSVATVQSNLVQYYGL